LPARSGDEPPGQRAAQRDDQQGAGGEYQQGAEPAHAADQARRHGNHQELAEGTGRSDHAHGPAAPGLGHQIAQRGEHHAVGAAALRRAYHQAGRRGEAGAVLA
jgi:hypothetical protein